MPVFSQAATASTGVRITMSGFKFSNANIDLSASCEYTVVTIAQDVSGSVSAMRNILITSMKSVVEACKKSPTSENIIIRTITFDDNTQELHGFTNLNALDMNVFDGIRCGGMTALYDAIQSSIEASFIQCNELAQKDFSVNNIMFIITDGMENASRVSTRQTIQSAINAAKISEIQQTTVILIGLENGQSNLEQYLKDMVAECGFDNYIYLSNANHVIDEKMLAKMAGIISRSISSHSQAIASGATAPVPSLTI